jgi:hypothetical protein
LSGQKAGKGAWAIVAAMGFGALIAQMFSTVIGPHAPDPGLHRSPSRRCRGLV